MRIFTMRCSAHGDDVFCLQGTPDARARTQSMEKQAVELCLQARNESATSDTFVPRVWTARVEASGSANVIITPIPPQVPHCGHHLRTWWADGLL